jgi:hypothetical protein
MLLAKHRRPREHWRRFNRGSPRFKCRAGHEFKPVDRASVYELKYSKRPWSTIQIQSDNRSNKADGRQPPEPGPPPSPSGLAIESGRLSVHGQEKHITPEGHRRRTMKGGSGTNLKGLVLGA